LLHSQFEAIEEPVPEEHPIIVSIEPLPREIVARMSAMNMVKDVSPEQTSLQLSGAEREQTGKDLDISTRNGT
jgi:hypothetical protein